MAPPAPATLEKHRRFLVTFFGNLAKTKAIPMSPMDAFAEINKDLAVDTDKPERLFDEEELQRIFDPKIFTAGAKKDPHRWWLPYSGSRPRERVHRLGPGFGSLSPVARRLHPGLWSKRRYRRGAFACPRC